MSVILVRSCACVNNDSFKFEDDDDDDDDDDDVKVHDAVVST